MRCDCGYDFSMRTMEASFVQADRERKHGGRSNLLRAASRQDIRNGALLVAVFAPLSAALFVQRGRVGIFVLAAVFWGIILILRGARFRREASEAEHLG